MSAAAEEREAGKRVWGGCGRGGAARPLLPVWVVALRGPWGRSASSSPAGRGWAWTPVFTGERGRRPAEVLVVRLGAQPHQAQA